jgi:hypothetical protein
MLTVIWKKAPGAMVALEQLALGGVKEQVEKPPLTSPVYVGRLIPPASE